MTPFEVEASAARDVAAGVDVAGVEDVAVGVVVAVGADVPGNALGDCRPQLLPLHETSQQLWPLLETCKLFFTKYSNSLRSCCFFHLNFSETLTSRRS